VIVVQVVGMAQRNAEVGSPIQIVLVGGTAIRNGLASSLQSAHAHVLSTNEENATFLLTGDQSGNVKAVVVEVDRYSLSLVHDLRTVFPNLPLIVLTNDPAKLSRSVTAGATIALPGSTATSQVAKVVRRLISK
jgi:hypothetical protein